MIEFGDKTFFEEKINEMKLKGFFKQTIKAYTFHYKKFKESNLSRDDFILSLIEKCHAANTSRLASAAIRFFEGKDNNQFIPKKDKRLPLVLTKQEINKMIKSLDNIKHRLVISLLYSLGLRLPELINLKPEQVNYIDDTILIKSGKGKKDRITLLSKKIKSMLRQYKAGEKYVFEYQGKRYSKRSIQEIIKNASRLAGIKQNVTPHTLRHSFATHLLEKGTDIRFIQKLLGHSSLRTMQIYTHVADNNIKRIKSPYD